MSKKLSILILAGAIAFTPAMACEDIKISNKDLKMESYNFSGTKELIATEGKLKIILKNTSDKEIIAWSGLFNCNNALGDHVIELGLKDENANIQPNETDSATFKDYAFGWGDNAWDIIANGIDTNYSCQLDVKKVALK